jgi:ERCC4-type nuclease
MSSDPTITILADSRESASVILPRLQQLGAHVKVGDLEAGGYVICGAVAVERMIAHEFVESVMDGKLFHKAGKMRLNFSRSVFLIEGDVYSTGLSIAREAIDGALTSLVLLEGASVLYIRNASATADLIFRLAKKAQKNLGFEMAFQRAKVSAGPQEALFSIESFAGIGPSTAPKALKRFRSVFGFVNANVQQLMTIPGIGQKKAERIFSSLRIEHGADDQALSQDAELPAGAHHHE